MEDEPGLGQEQLLDVENQVESTNQVEQRIDSLSESLDPILKEQISNAFTELNNYLAENKEGSVIVFREDAEETTSQEMTARRILLAGLGVRDFMIEVYPSETASENRRYLERFTTNLPGVEVVYADSESGGRTISIAVNHDLEGQKRSAPTDIERVLRSAESHEDWMESIEQFGPNFNFKEIEVRGTKLLAIDIDECVFPSVDRRVASTKQLEQLAAELKSLTEMGMLVVFNTGRAASETLKVIEYFEELGVNIDGAITEGGAISLRRDENGEWLQERNPTISQEQWDAVQLCKNYLDENFVQNGLGHQEPKVSAVTFTLNQDSGYDGRQILVQLKKLLEMKGLPTDVVDRADVSAGGIQLFAGVDKAEGMRYLHSAHGITKEETFAIGDSPGDLPMFAEAGVTAAPYNARLREIGEKVDYQSPFDAEYGVVDIIRQIKNLKQSS